MNIHIPMDISTISIELYNKLAKKAVFLQDRAREHGFPDEYFSASPKSLTFADAYGSIVSVETKHLYVQANR